MRRLVAIPARNEASTLADVIRGVRGALPGAHILVVDDASTDATAEIARRMAATVLRHPFHLGYGVALQTAYKYAARKGYDLLIQMDGDGQHDPEALPALAGPIQTGEADVVIGSRFLAGGWHAGPVRMLGVRFFRILFRLIARARVTDPTSGFLALGGRAIRFCTLDHFPFDYPDTDTLILLKKAGLRVVEVPARMHPRRTGRSMHDGLLHPLYYLFKVGVSILATVFREAHAYLEEPPEPREREEDQEKAPEGTGSDP